MKWIGCKSQVLGKQRREVRSHKAKADTARCNEMESGPHEQYQCGKGDGPPEKDKINAAVVTPRLAAVTNQEWREQGILSKKSKQKISMLNLIKWRP